MSRNLSPANLNTHDLRERADTATVKSWAASMRKYPGYREARPAPRIFGAVMLSLLVLPLVAFWVAIIVGLVTGAFHWESITVPRAVVVSPALALVFVITFASVRGLGNYFRGLGQWQRWYRMNKFSEANGFTFSVIADPSLMPGTIAAGGFKVTRDDYFSVPTEPAFEYGTVTRHTITFQVAGSTSWAFIEFRTPTRLPHMMLEVKGSKTRTYTFRSSQRVPLDREFAKDFTLYATEGSHATALELFTPPLLRLISQTDRRFNIEVIEDRIILHSARLFKLERAKEHERVIRLADTVGRGLIANAEAISTPAASTSMVSQDAADSAHGGKPRTRTQMLRTRYSVGGIILGTAVILAPIVMLIAGAFIND